jgi:hypothetical protein
MRTIMSSAALIAAVVSVNLNADDTGSYAAQARAITRQFATKLNGELQNALQNGGPLQAVGVCKERPPAIAAALSEKSGWQVRRSGLKPRNMALDTPDLWEQHVLRQSEDRNGHGEAVDSLTYAEVVDENGGRRYRYMQAIPTTQVCLACHGSNIDPTLVQTIDAAYPGDQGRGFAVGDIRGAFILSRPR